MKKNTITIIKVENKSDKTIAGKLEGIIRQAFPMSINTGLANDVGTIKPEPKSRGKAVLFSWRKTVLRLSEAMRVTERNFCNDFVISPLSVEAQEIIECFVNPPVGIMQQKIEDQQAEQEVITEAAMS